MSGGVDSAVALLRAGPNAVGVTLRLWLDPGRTRRRARVLLARRRRRGARAPVTRSGVPHVTLDLREEFRERRRRARSSRLRGGGDAEPVHPLQRRLPLRRAARLRRSVQAPSSLWTGHYARIVERDGRLARRRAPTMLRRTSRTCSPAVDPALLERVWFPLGEQTKEETRAEAAAAGLAAAGAAESQEACFLGGDDYRAFLERHGLRRAPGRSSTTDGTSSSGAHDGYWRFTPGQRRGPRRRRGRAAVRPAHRPRREHGRRRPARGARRRLASRRRGACTPGRARRGEAPLPLAGGAASVTATNGGFALELDEPAYGVARGQAAVVYDDDVVVGAGSSRTSA